ncbi:MAG: FAD:protein FMN transferase [Desulfobacterales bacterium]|nr:FAD:protein FMN transferase [Desulfobacterales bacterium]
MMIDKDIEIRRVNRRSFLKYSGLLGAGLLVPGFMPVSESVAFDRRLYKITRTRLTMGTFAAITLIHPSRAKADEAIGMAFDEMDRVGRLLTRYQTGSPVGTLNQDGFANGLPPEVMTVLSRSIHFNRISRGAFDVTVKPLVDLYKDHFASYHTPPSRQQINNALDRVDSRAICFNNNSVRFEKEGMGITLDGIAKGYIIDCGIDVLMKNKVRHGLINAGGDIRVIGGRDGKTPWSVAIQNPEKNGENVNRISMINGAIATSGNYEVYFDREKLYHHIMNPQNGAPAPELKSVTVLAGNAMDADALSTAVFVAGANAGKALIEALPGTECLLMGSRGKNSVSSRWPSA